jgi:AmiR/NasT family two-component response regulator
MVKSEGLTEEKPPGGSAAALAAGCSAHLTKPFDFDRLNDPLRLFVPGYEHAARRRS